ncbi:MAG: hypothetical protein AAFX41_15935 [Bacteroidota bacterium]
MGLVETWWRKGRAGIGPAIFFSDDRFIRLNGYPEAGYEAEVRGLVRDTKPPYADWLCYLVAFCEARDGTFRVIGYGTSWEGEGALALTRDQRFLWIASLPDAEIFREVSIRGDVIEAVSEEYPFRYTWRIPLDTPENLSVVGERL